jgi:hypothetical protein
MSTKTKGHTTICMRDGQNYFADDVLGTCVQCSHAVRYRPYSLPGPKLCFECHKANGGFQSTRMVVTTRTLAELKLLYATPQGRS